MCGRYHVENEEDVFAMREIIDMINRRLGDKPETQAMRTGEIFPTNIAPVIIRGQDGIVPGPMAWGMPGAGRPIINARQETIHEKPMFAKSFQERRVVIPTTGFYEWSHDAKKKAIDKFLFRIPGEKMLYLAGIWNTFTLPSGKREARFAIITTEPNSSMTPFHDRMPVMLYPDEREAWLNGSLSISELIKRKQPMLEAMAMEKKPKPEPEPPSESQLSLF